MADFASGDLSHSFDKVSVDSASLHPKRLKKTLMLFKKSIYEKNRKSQVHSPSRVGRVNILKRVVYIVTTGLSICLSFSVAFSP
jgi:hypothetical protein